MRSHQYAIVVAISVYALFVHPAESHHSVRDSFDADRPIRIEGNVMATLWVNPHMLFRIEVANGRGRSDIWTLEMPSPNALKRRGIEPDFLTVGAYITVECWPALDGSLRADTRLIEFADGRQIEVPESRWMSLGDPRSGDRNMVFDPADGDQ